MNTPLHLLKTDRDTFHRVLLDAGRRIGGICETASWASEDLAKHLHSLGKTVGELTVSELLQHITQQEERQRRIYGGWP